MRPLARLQPRTRRRFSAWVARLIAFVLVAHCFDACAAHTGLPQLDGAAISAASIAQAELKSSCALPGHAPCAQCSEPEPHQDGCEVTSEVATAPDGFRIQPPLLLLSFTIVLPDTIDVTPATRAALSRAGPDIAVLRFALCRNPLLGRAPPLA